MSFASDVRGELGRVPVSDACCARSELTSALLCAGGIAWRGRGRYAVTITAAEGSTVRRYFGLLKQFMGIVGQIRTLTGDALIAADTNGDGEINIADATHLQMFLAEYDVQLG